jgi:kynurenine formamidase
VSEVLGALASLTPASVRAALGLVSDGVVVDLSLPMDPALLPPGDPEFVRPFARTDIVTPTEWNERLSTGADGFHVDAVGGSIHLGSHLDGLTHLVHEGRIFGGHPEAEARGADGWTVAGIETVPPILVRGVLIDLVTGRGGSPLQGSDEVTIADLTAAMRGSGGRVEPGDAVLIRTGKMESLAATRETFLDAQPGIGLEAAIHLAEAGMVLLGSDTGGTEPQPIRDWARTVHAEMLVRRGIHLLEWLDLAGLASALEVRGRTTFLLVVLPLRWAGATGSWVRPIAVL